MKIGQFNNEISSNTRSQLSILSFLVLENMLQFDRDIASAKYPPIVFRDLEKYKSLLSASA